jgi:hypothetical protein
MIKASSVSEAEFLASAKKAWSLQSHVASPHN